MRGGLVSVTFRKLAPRQIVDLVATAGLEAIEWGGDIHVPHGNLDVAREVGRRTRDAGLAVAAYGSYFSLNRSEAEGLSWKSVLDTAQVLGAPCIRVWAGSVGSAEADEAQWAAVVEESLRIAESAAAAGLVVAYEFHVRTLTDTNESAAELLRRADHPHLKSLWQPRTGASVEENLAGIEGIAPRLHHAHVFHWWPTTSDRHALADGRTAWRSYLSALRRTPARWALLEFVRENSPEAFIADARTLRELLDEEGSCG